MGEEKNLNLVYEFDYMYKDEVCTNVKVYSDKNNEESVVVTDYTDNVVYRAFGNWSTKVTMDDVKTFLESRCVPRSRQNVRDLVNAVGSPVGFNARFFISVTHGTMADDMFWIRFSTEPDLTWDDVKVWKHVGIDK